MDNDSATSETLNGVNESASSTVRIEIVRFISVVKIFYGDDQTKIKQWEKKIRDDIEEFNLEYRNSDEKEMLAIIELVKQEFVAHEIGPKTYRYLVWLWIWTLVGCLVAFALFGGDGLLAPFQETKLIGAIYGHFYCYIAFYYALVGVLIGNALLVTYRDAKSEFIDLYKKADLLARPVLRMVVGFAIAYILARLVAEDLLSFKLLGFEITHTNADVCGGSNTASNFQNNGTLFVIGLFASIASDIYLMKLIDSMRRSADSVLSSRAPQNNNHSGRPSSP